MFLNKREITLTVLVLFAGFTIGTKVLLGDDVTDDTIAIQKVVDTGIGIVRLTKGVYRITRPIVIDLDKVGYTSFIGGGVARIVMAGPGPALKFVGTHFKSADPGGFAKNVWERQRMPLVDGIAIEGGHPGAKSSKEYNEF